MRLPFIIPSGFSVCKFYSKIKECSSLGKWEDVISHWRKIPGLGSVWVDHMIFSDILKACKCIGLPCSLGKSVHAYVVKREYEAFPSLNNSLMDFYAKSEAFSYSIAIFNCMKTKDSVSWNIILWGYFNTGSLAQGLDLYILAKSVRFEPNVSTLVLLVQALHSLKAFNGGMAFHGYLIRCGFRSLKSVQNSVLIMYADFCMCYAETLFDEMIQRDVISWSVMIKGYISVDDCYFAMDSFKKIVSDCKIDVDGQMMVSIIKGCSNFGDIRIGQLFHGYVVKRALNDLFVGNTLIDLYGKCRDVDSAVVLFNEMPVRNVVSWNSLLSGFIYNEKYTKALGLYSLMLKSRVDMDEVTLGNLLQIFKLFADLSHCKMIHCRVVRRGIALNDLVMNSLIDAYAKCSQIETSWRIFCRIKRPDVVTWSTMISGFTNCGMPVEAITLYKEMQFYVESPTFVTLLNLLEACGVYAEVRKSKWAHGLAIRMGLASNILVGTAVLDMYSKCGAIEASRRALDEITEKNVVSWSALIAAYGLNGQPYDALSLLSEMKAKGVKPNSVTSISLLSACCHGGLVEEGISIFNELTELNKSEHNCCLVDLLARSGNLDEAWEFIKLIPVERGSGWGALLSGSRSFENQKMTAEAVSHVVELEPRSSAGYLLASNCYAVRGSWTEFSEMRYMMKQRGIKVDGGHSLVHIGDSAFTFTAGAADKSHHPLSQVIHQLHSCMKALERD